MKRIDHAMSETLSSICRGNGSLSKEQIQRNREWVVKVRKQIDAARIKGVK